MRFRGKYSCFSNMHPCEITYKNLTFHNAEAAYQAQKCANEDDKLQFTKLTDPVEAKRLGSQVKLVDNWDEIKLEEMGNIVFIKFTQNPRLARVLISTGNETIVEENYHRDKYWGTYKGEGENHLGKILMGIRSKIHAKVNNCLWNMSQHLSSNKK